jgi:peptide chain release factor subunit 1
MGRIVSEITEASNIKSRTTRQGVLTALTQLLSRLRTVARMPANGLVCFVGDGVDVVMEPPEPVSAYLYRCGSTPEVGPLKDMLEEKEIYGLIVIDRAEATLGWLRGSTVIPAENMASHLMGKHDAGGQSQHRFERIMEGEEKAWYRRVAEQARLLFGPRLDTLLGILVGGPGDTKNRFLLDGGLDYRLAQSIRRPTYPTCYTEEYGLRELVNAATPALKDSVLAQERRTVQRFLDGARTGKAIYGYQQIGEALTQGRVDTLILSRACTDAEALATMARDTGATVVLVGTGTDEGVTLLRGFGGAGATVRW